MRRAPIRAASVGITKAALSGIVLPSEGLPNCPSLSWKAIFALSAAWSAARLARHAHLSTSVSSLKSFWIHMRSYMRHRDPIFLLPGEVCQDMSHLHPFHWHLSEGLLSGHGGRISRRCTICLPLSARRSPPPPPPRPLLQSRPCALESKCRWGVVAGSLA